MTNSLKHGDSSAPKLNMIFQGEVLRIQEFGAFIKIPHHYKDGLVHKSQLSQCKVENVSEVLQQGDKIWCKVISISEDGEKIGLSMKVVNQGNGADLDPAGVQIAQDQKRQKKYIPKAQTKITLDAIFNTVCKKCGTKGHLAQNCFQTPEGKTYDLIPEIPDSVQQQESMPKERDKKKKKKDKKKKKKHKKTHSAKRRDSSSSESSDEKDRSRSHRKRQRSSSFSDDQSTHDRHRTPRHKRKKTK